jgi:hypothetical protein
MPPFSFLWVKWEEDKNSFVERSVIGRGDDGLARRGLKSYACLCKKEDKNTCWLVRLNDPFIAKLGEFL